MIGSQAAGVNVRPPSPPKPTPRRYPCPLCGTWYEHPAGLAVHLAAVDPARPDHGMTEDRAWLEAATVLPIDPLPARPGPRPGRRSAA